MSSPQIVEKNKQLVRRVFEDCVNQRKLDLLTELIGDEYVGVAGGKGPASFAGPLRGLCEGFPDIQYTLSDMTAEGDRVAVRWQWKGTHQASYRGPTGTVYPATGKSIVNDGIAIFQLDGGKVIQGWLMTDRLGFIQEMGVSPRSVAAPPRETT